MSDMEFVEEFKSQSITLHAFFLRHIEKGKGDKAEDADDLVQETAKLALPYSRRPEYANRVNRLIWIVAWNVLCRHYKKGKRRLPSYHAREELRKHLLRDPLQSFINKDRWAKLKTTMDATTWTICQLRSDGYEYQEIAMMLDLSIGAVKMRIQRLI